MPIQFACSQCQKKMKAPDGTEGKKARCPACSAITRIPGAKVAAAAAVPVAQLARPAKKKKVAPVAKTESLFDDNTFDDNPFAAPATADFSGAPAARDQRSRKGLPSWDAGPSIGSFFKTSIEVLTKPTDTFRNMIPEGGLGRPMAYASIIGALMGIGIGLLAVAFLALAPTMGGAGGEEVAMLMGVGIGALVVLPVMYAMFMPVGCLMLAGMMHVMLMIVGAKKYGYSATARCFTYAYLAGWPVMLLSGIPFLGVIIAIPWAIWLMVIYVIGFSEVHETTKGKVVLALLVPFVLLIVLGIALAIVGNVAQV